MYVWEKKRKTSLTTWRATSSNWRFSLCLAVPGPVLIVHVITNEHCFVERQALRSGFGLSPDGFMENPKRMISGYSNMSTKMTWVISSHTESYSQTYLPVLPVSGPMVQDVLAFLATHRHSWAQCSLQSHLVCFRIVSESLESLWGKSTGIDWL